VEAGDAEHSVVDQFGLLLRTVRETRQGALWMVPPWRVPLAERVLLVAVDYRTNLTRRQLASPFGVYCD
jgi:hypothetical protein